VTDQSLAVDATRATAYCSHAHKTISEWFTSAQKVPSLELQVTWGTARLAEIKPAGSMRPLIAALLGGSGTGKSELINALFRKPGLCVSSTRRPTTRQPKAVHHPSFNPAGFLPQTTPPIVYQDVLDDLVEQMVLVDCPDFDAKKSRDVDAEGVSRENNDAEARRASLEAVLAVADVIIVVVTWQKHWEAKLWKEVGAFVRDGRALVVVQTHRDTPASSDLRKRIKLQFGKRNLLAHLPTPARFVYADSKTELAGRDGGLASLRTILRNEIASNARRRVLFAREIESYVRLTTELCDEIGPKAAAVEGVKKATGTATRELYAIWRKAITDRLPVIMPRLAVHFDDQLSSTMAGTTFGRFLELLSNSFWLFGVVGALRAKGWMRILTVAGTATATVVEKVQREVARDAPWLEGVDFEAGPNARAEIFEPVTDAWIKASGPLRLDAARAKNERVNWEQAGAAELRRIGAELETKIRRRIAIEAHTTSKSWKRFVVAAVFLFVPAFGLFLLAKSYFVDVPINGKPALGVDFILLTCFLTVVWGLILKRLLFRQFAGLVEAQVKEVLKQDVDGQSSKAIFQGIVAEVAPVESAFERLSSVKKELEELRGRVLGAPRAENKSAVDRVADADALTRLDVAQASSDVVAESQHRSRAVAMGS
jgi:hypothetical protein